MEYRHVSLDGNEEAGLLEGAHRAEVVTEDGEEIDIAEIVSTQLQNFPHNERRLNQQCPQGFYRREKDQQKVSCGLNRRHLNGN